MKEHGVPGAALGVFHDGRSYARGLGVTSLENPLTVTDDTLFQIGSITKTFTGTLLMQLVEKGRVDLAAPVRRYLPDFAVADPDASARATVRDLVTHVGGWEGDLFDDTGDGDDALARIVDEMKALEQQAPLGFAYSYNNAGFYAAARIIEVVTGKPYETVLEEHVLRPLGLEESFIRPQDVMTRRFVVGHLNPPGGPEVARPWPVARAAHAVGGLTCSVRDVLRYAQFHLGDGRGRDGAVVLSTAALARMREPIFQKQGIENEYMALTWHLEDRGGLRRVSHSGGTLGQAALLTFVPARGLAVVLLTNGARGARVNREVTRAAIKEFLGVEDKDPEPLANVTDADLAAYAGLYARAFAEVDLTVKDGRLMAAARQKQGFPTRTTPIPPPLPPFPLALYAKDRVIAVEGPAQGARGEFLRGADGSIAYFRWSGRINRRVR